MPQRTREVIAVRRDISRRITHIIVRDESGERRALPVDEAIRAMETLEQWFYVMQGNEALLVQIERRGDAVQVSSPVRGAIDVPDE